MGRGNLRGDDPMLTFEVRLYQQLLFSRPRSAGLLLRLENRSRCVHDLQGSAELGLAVPLWRSEAAESLEAES